MLAGMMARPRAISLRTSSGSIFSRLATKSISSVTTPLRARCICDMFLLPLAAAASDSRFSIQVSRNAIEPPVCAAKPDHGRRQRSVLQIKRKYGIEGRLAATDGEKCSRVTERTENKKNRRWELECTFGGDGKRSRGTLFFGKMRTAKS